MNGEKKRVHLIANAHLDPMWLWRWEEGCTEALSTFLTASELLDEFEEFRFNHNESLIYEWVKDHNPELFEKIKKQVTEKRWEIIGGWFLQPDCNMPSGESMIRNIMLGRKFFKDEFNAYPKTAVNFDSFGHSRGLVQILKQSGYENYLVYRPGHLEFSDADFIWKGLNDSAVVVHRSDEGYNSIFGKAAEKIEDFVNRREKEEISLCLWGIGDHGGGPSKRDLEDLRKTECTNKCELVHSTPDEYFEELKKWNQDLKIVEHGLNPVCEGCYTSQIRVKQKHRELENEIYSTEKMAVAASLQYGRTYRKEIFDEAVRDLIFSEFHDALPGSGSQYVEEDTLRLLDHGLELMSREKLYSAIALSAGEPRVIHETSVIMFYNPHPYDITGVFECEVSLPVQNWDPCFKYPTVVYEGSEIPTQAEKESSHFQIDWRKKVVVQATLRAFSMNRMDVYFKDLEKRPEYHDIVGKPNFEFKSEDMEICINTRTGLLDCYCIKGKQYLGENSGMLELTDDSYNPWGIGSGESACKRDFQLLTPHEGSAFCGLRDKVVPSVRVIEDGEVRTVVEAVFGIHDSKAYIRYKMPKQGTGFEIEVLINFAEKEQSLKMLLHTVCGEQEKLYGQIMYGREELRKNGRESVAQKWVMVADSNTNQALSVLNNGTYGVNHENGKLGLTLLRSAGYSAADCSAGKPYQEKQYASRMEQGVRTYSFYINAGEEYEISDYLDREAQSYNEKPYGMAFCPPGTGVKKDKFLTIDNPAVIVSGLKQAEESQNFILRLYEGAGKNQKAMVTISSLSIKKEITFKPYEIKTYIINKEKCGLEETTIIEGI